MNRFIALLLSLCLLLGLFPAAMAEAAAVPEAAALPGVGDVIHGFEVIETRDYPLLDAVIVRFEHRQTGAELYYIANDDTNRAFDLVFFTDALDNTGLPHVFEHATTAGSKKYPSTSLWFNLSYQTYNTYFNALTSKRFTAYPFATLSEAQLLKFADYYTDSCFSPLLMENEQIYRTEAWRYRLEDPEDPLTIEGTVYSEMLGATTLNRVANTNALRAMFPGSTVGNDAGGDPDFIPDMTWQMLRDYHDLYYHPSNCAAYLYGQIEDYEAFLQLLDGYFSVYEKREFVHTDDGYAPIEAPVVQSLPFPVEQGSGTEHASTVYYGFVCPGLNQDPEQERLLNTLTDLLGTDSSQMQQRLQEVLPYGSFSTYIEIEGPEDAIVFVASKVDPEDAEVFKAAVDESLREVAADGFPQDQVDAVMASLSISALLMREGSDPVDGIIENLVYSYASTGDPWNYLDYQDGLFLMDEWNRQGLYAQGVSDWLLDSQTTALVTTYPEPGAKEEKDAALAEKLAQVKAAMSDEEIAALVAATNAEPEEDDASQYVAQLQAVTVPSLPEELKRYDVTDETGEDGIRRIDALAGVEGVGKATVLLDAEGLAQEDIHWCKLYTDLLGDLDTAAHTKAELAKLVGRYLYGGAVDLTTVNEGEDGFRPCLSLQWIALDDDLDEGYDLMRELLFDTKVDDPARLLELVQGLKADLKASVTASPASVLLRRSLATVDEKYRYRSYAFDLDYYDFLVDVEQRLKDDPDGVVASLQGIQATLNNRENAVAIFSGNADSIALNRELADQFLASLDSRPIQRATYDLPVPQKAEALVIDSSAQYNLLSAAYAALDMEGYDAGLSVVSSAINDLFLIPLLRDGYGVYTPQAAAMQEGGMYIYAYRDPNIAETFALLDELPGMISEIEMDQQTLDGYILSAYSDLAMPEGELSGANSAAMRALQGKPWDEELTWMRQLKQVTPDALRGSAELFAKLGEVGVRSTAGGASAINANADLYDAILNPFGAVDNSQVALTDAPEGSEHYDAVRFAFEEGFMATLDGETFGVDEPATCGDLLAALYVLIGGERDANEALGAFVEYGLLSEDTDLSAPIAPEDVWGLLSAIVGEEVPPMTETAADDTVTRAELAEALMAFASELEPAEDAVE